MQLLPCLALLWVSSALFVTFLQARFHLGLARFRLRMKKRNLAGASQESNFGS